MKELKELNWPRTSLQLLAYAPFMKKQLAIPPLWHMIQAEFFEMIRNRREIDLLLPPGQIGSQYSCEQKKYAFALARREKSFRELLNLSRYPNNRYDSLVPWKYVIGRTLFTLLPLCTEFLLFRVPNIIFTWLYLKCCSFLRGDASLAKKSFVAILATPLIILSLASRIAAELIRPIVSVFNSFHDNLEETSGAQTTWGKIGYGIKTLITTAYAAVAWGVIVTLLAPLFGGAGGAFLTGAILKSSTPAISREGLSFGAITSGKTSIILSTSYTATFFAPISNLFHYLVQVFFVISNHENKRNGKFPNKQAQTSKLNQQSQATSSSNKLNQQAQPTNSSKKLKQKTQSVNSIRESIEPSQCALTVG